MLIDVWSSIKARSIAGDLGDKVRNLPYVQSLGFLSRRSEPVLTLELVPAVKTLRTNLISTRFLPTGGTKEVGSIITGTPKSFFSGARDEPERSGIRIQGSRAILPGTGIDATKRVKIM